MPMGISPISIIVMDIANSVFLKCRMVLSVILNLNSDNCFTITLTIKNMATALMLSSISIYGINSIIFCPIFLADAHQPLGIF